MWPRTVDWEELRFGVEIEFVGGNPAAVELLPGWVMAFDELQVDDTGEDSGAELKPPPLLWRDREQMRVMLDRLKATGARANWSCGLHVHVGLEPWGQDIVLPLVDAALAHQDALRGLLRTAEDRLIHCPPVVPAMRDRYLVNPERASLVRRGRPQSHRCGINAAAWFDFGTVEIRYPNGSLEYDEVGNTVELCLRFVAAVGRGGWRPRLRRAQRAGERPRRVRLRPRRMRLRWPPCWALRRTATRCRGRRRGGTGSGHGWKTPWSPCWSRWCGPGCPRRKSWPSGGSPGASGSRRRSPETAAWPFSRGPARTGGRWNRWSRSGIGPAPPRGGSDVGSST